MERLLDAFGQLLETLGPASRGAQSSSGGWRPRQRDGDSRPNSNWSRMRSTVYREAEMQKTTHPELRTTTVVCASCGTTFETHSAAGDLSVEVCSQCHPAYTGVERSTATGTRVERFERRRARASVTSAAR
jgi:large subunit ribosomal protein L31